MIHSFRTPRKLNDTIAGSDGIGLPVNQPLELSIEPYAGQNRYVRKLMQYLERHLKHDLFGAYVHGSLGTYEEIPYSDFDALVILKNEVFESAARLARIADKLRKATSIMYEFDPLQHHGWFVLTEADLKCYPEAYFPHELFFYAKSLLRDRGLQFTIYLNDEPQNNLKEPFLDLSNHLLARLLDNRYPNNAYQLKGLLSQFMLLPALYLQARNGKGVYKKFSFGKASKHFSQKQWAIMDEVSAIRATWDYQISALKKKLLSSSHLMLRRYARTFGPAIPVKLKDRLTPDFYQQMRDLVVVMQEKLKNIATNNQHQASSNQHLTSSIQYQATNIQ